MYASPMLTVQRSAAKKTHKSLMTTNAGCLTSPRNWWQGDQRPRSNRPSIFEGHVKENDSAEKGPWLSESQDRGEQWHKWTLVGNKKIYVSVKITCFSLFPNVIHDWRVNFGGITALQCCVSFFYRAKWINHTYTQTSLFEFPSH